ncbi:MAG: hypothetical protein B7Z52_05660 [Burkholderiales bacterium 12-64-5]|nr:MAG: hypothetical protein B7Z52_05660 [Burkholderiales bacterium 12-64-5]
MGGIVQGVLSEAILDKVGVSNLFGMPWKIAKAGEGGPAPMWRNLSKFHSFNAWVYVRSGRRWTEWAGYPQEMLNGSGRRARIVNCDMQLDAVNSVAMQEGRALLSRPYQKSGVALGLGRDASPITDYKELLKDQKIGVMVNSVASVVLGKNGATISPYAFQDDMIEDLAKGEIYGAAVSIASLSYYIKTHPESGIKLAYAFDSAPELGWDVAIGLRKSDQALVDEVNRVLDQLIADGTLDRIYAKYGVERRQP